MTSAEDFDRWYADRAGTLTATGLIAGSVDAVLIVDSVQFAESKQDALRECQRVLRPGGRLVVTCWQAAEPRDERVWRRIRELDLATATRPR